MHPCYLQKMQHEAQVRLYLDGCDGEGDLPPTIDVRVQNTKNVLELLRDDQRLKTQHTRYQGGMSLSALPCSCFQTSCAF